MNALLTKASEGNPEKSSKIVNAKKNKATFRELSDDNLKNSTKN